MRDRRRYVRPPGRDEFLRAIGMLDFVEHARVSAAYGFSEVGHMGQTRDDGTPYVGHSQIAAWIFIFEFGGRDARVIIDLLLHDVAENGKLFALWLLSNIYIVFGLQIGLDAQAITKIKGESIEAYFARIIERGPHLILVKLIDRLHNLRTLDACTPKKRRRQIKETKRYHLPILVPALRSCGGEWAKYADQAEEKILEAMAYYRD